MQSPRGQAKPPGFRFANALVDIVETNEHGKVLSTFDVDDELMPADSRLAN